MTHCAATKKSGAPCGGKRVEGSEFCSFHDPNKAKAVARGRQAGGKEATKKPEPEPELPELPLETAEHVIAIARDAVNRVRSHQMNPKQGTAIGSLLNVVLGAMKLTAEKKGEDKERPLSEETAATLQEAYRAIQANH